MVTPVKKILIRAPNWIGDAVMAIPTLSAIRTGFKEATITLLAKAAVLSLFEHHPTIDTLLAYESPGDHSGPIGILRLSRRLRKESFDLAILLPNSFESALIVALARIPKRVGYATDGRRWLLTDHAIKPNGHQQDVYLGLLRLLRQPAPPSQPYLIATADERQAARKWLAPFGVLPSDSCIGVQAGAAYGSAKRWDARRFAETVDALVAEQPAHVLLLGSANECGVAEEVRRHMRHPAIQLAGKTTLRQMVALISQCRFFLSNDSGPMHIASALGVPLAAIFGPTSPMVTSPGKRQGRVVSHPVECAPCTYRDCPIDHRCMTSVSVARVLEVANRELQTDLKTAVFFDRDGTLNEEVGYLDTVTCLTLTPNAAEAIRRLNQEGILVIIVTNQSGVARGFFTEGFVSQVHHRLAHLLAMEGAHIDGVYYCPHHPNQQCRCRKPATGMIEQAVRDYPIDYARSYVVGDRLTDTTLARQGAKGILVRTGYGNNALQEIVASSQNPHYVADDLSAAVTWILRDRETVLAKTDKTLEEIR